MKIILKKKKKAQKTGWFLSNNIMVNTRPGEGNGNPLQYSCLENPMYRGAWRSTVHGVMRVGHDLVTVPPPPQHKASCIFYFAYCIWFFHSFVFCLLARNSVVFEPVTLEAILPASSGSFYLSSPPHSPSVCLWNFMWSKTALEKLMLSSVIQVYNMHCFLLRGVPRTTYLLLLLPSPSCFA